MLLFLTVPLFKLAQLLLSLTELSLFFAELFLLLVQMLLLLLVQLLLLLVLLQLALQLAAVCLARPAPLYSIPCHPAIHRHTATEICRLPDRLYQILLPIRIADD